ncbi:MAG: hypothetical protein AB8G16_12965 [Gammaproteobacteria bacterium]
MRLRHFFSAFIVTCTLGAQAGGVSNGLVDVDVVDDYGRSFPTFSTGQRHSQREHRAYLEARPGEAYAIRVTNRSGGRVGLVIAVDGRNIISGRKSKLRSKEKMYVLGPWQSAVYRGWRTSRNRINEFYFTSDLDSYAGAFGDFSAMGVVAVAAFEDRFAPQPHAYRDGVRKSQPEARSHKHGDAASERAAPGTGFGDERYAPSYTVEFEPQSRTAGVTLIKYEWRETLCRMGVTRCGLRENRFWPTTQYRGRHGDRGYAAYPPGYRQRETLVRSRRYQ